MPERSRADSGPPPERDPSKRWTLIEVLDWTRTHLESKGSDTPRLDAEVILSHVLGIERVMLYARFDQPLGAAELATIRGLVARRARGEPVAYLTGRREFWSLELEVTPATLIPRPDTEVVVEVALARVKAAAVSSVRALDVGTGSGCIALALAKELPRASVVGVDASREALLVAKRNRDRLGLTDRIDFVESDLFESLDPKELFGLVCANLPYIPSGEIQGLMRDVRDYEPRAALDGGPDGLVHIRRLIAETPCRLRPGGALVLEAGSSEMREITELLEAAGFTAIAVREGLSRLPRVISALRA